MYTKTTINILISGLSLLLLIGCKRNDLSTLNDDLAAYYNFNHNVEDHSGNGNNGTTYGGQFDNNGAFVFDGSNDYIVVKNNASLNPENEVAISIWFKPVDFYGIGNNALVIKPFSSHDPPYYQYLLGISGSKGSVRYTFGFSLNVDGEYKTIGTEANAWQEGNWYHIVGMYDGKNIKLYVNAVLKNTLTVEGSMNSFDTDLFFGIQPNLGVPTPGTIDNVRIYNRALHEKEILEIFNIELK